MSWGYEGRFLFQSNSRFFLWALCGKSKKPRLTCALCFLVILFGSVLLVRFRMLLLLFQVLPSLLFSDSHSAFETPFISQYLVAVVCRSRLEIASSYFLFLRSLLLWLLRAYVSITPRLRPKCLLVSRLDIRVGGSLYKSRCSVWLGFTLLRFMSVSVWTLAQPREYRPHKAIFRSL